MLSVLTILGFCRLGKDYFDVWLTLDLQIAHHLSGYFCRLLKKTPDCTFCAV